MAVNIRFTGQLPPTDTFSVRTSRPSQADGRRILCAEADLPHARTMRTCCPLCSGQALRYAAYAADRSVGSRPVYQFKDTVTYTYAPIYI